jgi:putative FmdB family regulatory protein
MPLYEYTCRGCAKRIEVLQPMGADARGLSCPSCGASRLVRVLSTFATASAPDTACAAPDPGFGCACNPGRSSCP